MLLVTTQTPEGRYASEFTADSPFALSVKFPEDAITIRNCRILTAAGDADLAHLKSYFQLPVKWEKEIPLNVFPRRIRLEFITCPLELEVTFHNEGAISDLNDRIAEQERINEEQQKQINDRTDYDKTQDENLTNATSIASAESVRSLFVKK